jgi:preprotein translocase subunit SecY
MRIIRSLGNIFKVPELRVRVLFTLGIIAVVRLGAFVPTPGVDGAALSKIIAEQASRFGGNLMMFMNMFSGGALRRCTIFALGVMPYISATIILQLLIAVVPALEKWQREGETGQKRIREIGRYGTFFLAAFQSFFIARYISNPNNFPSGMNLQVVPNPGFLFTLSTIFTLTCGTILLMWLGEQITDKGIGNGVSIIITVNILSRLPTGLVTTWKTLGPASEGGWGPVKFISLLLIFIGVIVGVVMITQGERRIPVQSAKRMVGRRQYAGQSTYIPFRVNYAGVMPIIFASSLLFFPATLGGFFPKVTFFSRAAAVLTPPSPVYYVAYAFLIIFFCFFWTATVFNPIQMAENLRKNNAFVPGIRPGKATSDFFDKTMTRITLSGAVALAFIALIPDFLNRLMGLPRSVSAFFGGTSLLIIVGVMLDTMRQIESYLVARHYEGFMNKGRLRGRSPGRGPV